MKRLVCAWLTCVAVACTRDPSASPAAEGAAWLIAGTDEERFERVARQLRGFDVAMVEVGYRYGELYWAGQDQNWDSARYQLEKIRTAMKNGVERRPKRGASAKMLDGRSPPSRRRRSRRIQRSLPSASRGSLPSATPATRQSGCRSCTSGLPK